MKTKTKKKKSTLEIIFYLIAAVLCAYSIYMLYESYSYVSDYATMYGTTVSEMGSDAVQYICSAFLPYLAYAVTIFGIGAIYGAIAPKKVSAVAEAATVAESTQEECEYSCCCEEKKETLEETTESACDCEGECACDSSCEPKGEAEGVCEETTESAAELDEKYKFNPSER